MAPVLFQPLRRLVRSGSVRLGAEGFPSGGYLYMAGLPYGTPIETPVRAERYSPSTRLERCAGWQVGSVR